MLNIIFVCTGNTCRSPMAEAILKEKLKLNKIKDVKVTSAGIRAIPNTVTSPNTIKALSTLGIKLKPTKAKQLTKDLVDDNTLIITVTKSHIPYVSGIARAMALSDFCEGIEVPDPYGQDLNVYIKCAKLFDFVCDEIINCIKKGEFL